ncbi:type II toxin-antitoxin system YafQ family toxin [Candidatus Kaiserbacteria bacterium]|nr:type II toxin-antitoxin system YafQ family toxin [Candidatus Kaiserbacteria bacterium]
MFNRSFRKLKKSGRLTSNLAYDFKLVTEYLCSGKILPEKYRDHALSGEFAGYRECHIKDDLLLMYEIRGGRIIVFVDTGSHAQLFE